ncbi:DUF309 domain-containing protein [Prochlorococcus marinus]|uniref:DUF309 domain-containing protein n=1 Tax=Prochlorococcus marinus TaxID=1219 RepID=UPI0022B58899|nr:DUF309 domain-containing protein [Prochlorococcus marinus]
MNSTKSEDLLSQKDSNFHHAIDLFNNQEWYVAHDVFEEIWHQTNGKERLTIQAILQIAVAEVHLSNQNYSGATILYGEGLGKIKKTNLPDLGLDLIQFSNIVEIRLKLLQSGLSLDNTPLPKLMMK